MSSFTVTAVFTVTADASAEAVQLEANRKLGSVAREVQGYGYGHGINGRSATLDSVTVEAAPEPEPTITLTESELQARIAECVADAIAEMNQTA